MATPAHIAVRLAEGILALTARDRFNAMQNLDSGSNSFMTSKWFTVAMVILLAGSVVAFLVVSFYRKSKELKAAEKTFSDLATKKGLTEPEIDTLMLIAVKAGLKNSEAIFSIRDIFERGAAILFNESKSQGKPTTETARLEKELAGLRQKMNYRKPASAPANVPAVPAQKSKIPVQSEKPKTSAAPPAKAPVRSAAFVAIFPFSKKIDSAGIDKGQQGSSPSKSAEAAERNRQLPEFLPATVVGLNGRIVSLETTLAATVGDRLLVMIGPADAEKTELIEDIGLVKQSAQPADSIKDPKARRLSVEMTGLNEAQMARLAEITGGAKTTKAAEKTSEAEDKTETVGAKKETE